MKRLRATINDLLVFLSLVRLHWAPRKRGEESHVDAIAVVTTDPRLNLIDGNRTATYTLTGTDGDPMTSCGN